MIYPSFNMYRSIGYTENYFNNILSRIIACRGALAMREHNEARQGINTIDGGSRLRHL